MRLFRKRLSNSSSTSISEEEAESAIEKGLWSKVLLHSKKLNDLNQKTNLNIRYFEIINGRMGCFELIRLR